jgi:phenylalanyl-tRNA synthetase beta chain
MKISVNWVREFTDVKLPIDELVDKIGAQLGGVEEVIDLAAKYKGVIIAKIVKCQPHPNADRLQVCTLDDGGITPGVKRDENGRVQVVCGAPNVREGLLVAWLPPGSTVPSSFDKDPFVLEARELRGVVSNGMLASAHELSLSDDHSGILEITEDVKPGESFAKVFGLDDTIIDVENKMFTHRPDCFGQLGVAREIAGIQGLAFESPDWYLKNDIHTKTSDVIKGYSVTNQIPDLCPRYMLVAIDNVKVGPSPAWLQSHLARVGVRPINNIVDMTNYLMVLTGQPLHAFDFDKVAVNGCANIVVRKPKDGEEVTLLDGKTIKPRKDAILICDQDKPIAVGGVMGGGNSEIDASTTRILIECANFDMYSIRKTSMAHGLFTDAVTRFNKGQSQWQCPPVLYKAAQMVQELCKDAIIAGDVVDFHEPSKKNQTVELTVQFINQRLGLDLSAEQIGSLLKNVEFSVHADKSELKIIAPFWRTDIEIPEDIVEEIGRLYGYDHLPLTLPNRSLEPAAKNQMFSLKSQIRDNLSAAGASELLTYSFVHGQLLDKVGQDKANAFQLSNALSPDLQYYRLSLTPSLLEKVHPNIKADYIRSEDNEFAIFELNKAHHKQVKSSDDLPKENNSLALVFAADAKTAKRKHVGAPYYQAKEYLTNLLGQFGANNSVTFEPLEGTDLSKNSWLNELCQPYEPKRSAILKDEQGTIWGVVGEYKTSVKKALKLPDFCAGFELGLLLLLQSKPTVYQPLAKFPKTQQDISFKIPANITYAQLFNLVWQQLQAAQTQHGYLANLAPIDIYQAQTDQDHKNITLRVWLSHPERTLTTEEVNKLLDHIALVAASSPLAATRL